MNYDFSYSDIVKQCDAMVFLNLISFTLLSGCGNIEMPQEEELTRIYELLKGTPDEKMPKNIMFMSSLYQRCLPEYTGMPDSPYDFSCFHWSGKKQKREIHPDTLSHSIFTAAAMIPKIRSGELKLDNPDFIAYCLAANAAKQAHFLMAFLKNGEFYYPGKDTGSNAYGEYCIDRLPEEPDLKTQFSVMEAFSSLNELGEKNPEYGSGVQDLLKRELELIPMLCDNLIEGVTEISSRDLAVIGLSLNQMHRSCGNHRSILFTALTTIGCELHERLFSSGDIGRSMWDHEASSFSTLCNCLNLFIRLYELTGMDQYHRSVFLIYDRIDSFWDPQIGLFVPSNRNKQRYSIKDIGFTTAALKALRSSLTDPDLFMYADRQFSEFYSSAFINSKIFNCQLHPILQQGKLEQQLLGSSAKNAAPVFSKSFEVKVNKKKYYCEPDIFQAEYVLLGCKYLMY